MDFINFRKGLEFEAYDYLGAHTYFGGTTFRTYAPSAKGVTLLGDFSNWQEIPMYKNNDGFWEVSVPDTKQGNLYKYKIYGHNSIVEHQDPYGFYSELRPNSASIVFDVWNYEFHDEDWMSSRAKLKSGPLNIYELHFGSWKKKDDTNAEGGWYSYTEMADMLIPYLKETGYNIVEIMPLGEYPCDASWGYQATGYFSPTSRYGTPIELKEFVDRCHQANIAVILDFVPVHFAIDSFGLRKYDGTSLFEYPHESVGINEWGSCNFMHSRPETCSFLQSAANYWLKEYHFDGLRMDAVGNLIYWQGNKHRGENRDAIRFLKTMNAGLKWRNPGAILCAEDSSAYPNVTTATEYGGLGFDFKWDMGWMNDTLEYFQTAPKYRHDKYHKLTFSMMYNYSEHFILPLSHDEVVHGKATIVNKMSDLYEGKFQQARALYMYMYSHPGAKLNFMGNELGQLREWDETRQQDFMLLDYPIHSGFHKFITDLNHLYLATPAMYELDFETRGFEWIDCHEEGRLIYAFRRVAEHQAMIAIFNFSYFEHDYQLNLSYDCTLLPLLSNDWAEYGGQAEKNTELIDVIDGKAMLKLAPYSAYFYEIKLPRIALNNSEE